MGNETILYYVTQESVTGLDEIIDIRFWQKINLPSFVLESDDKDDMTIIAIMLPKLEEKTRKDKKEKKWKKEKLLRAMEAAAAVHSMSQSAKVLMQPKVRKMISQMEAKRGTISEIDDFAQDSSLLWSLTEKILQKILPLPTMRYRQNALQKPMQKTLEKPLQKPLQAVILLLGGALFVEEQMQEFYDMMQPYFPYINRLMILYEPEDETAGSSITEDAIWQGVVQGREMNEDDVPGEDIWRNNIEQDGEPKIRQGEGFGTEAETRQDSALKDRPIAYDDAQAHEQGRWEEVIQEYTDEIYYEYGLVTWMQQYRKALVRRQNVRNGENPALFLDFGASAKIPFRAMQAGDLYLDVFSSEEKEALFRRKYMEISYFSPRKYLDTMVKSGYDRLVN